jgi:hypothetical protein
MQQLTGLDATFLALDSPTAYGLLAVPRAPGCRSSAGFCCAVTVVSSCRRRH